MLTATLNQRAVMALCIVCLAVSSARAQEAPVPSGTALPSYALQQEIDDLRSPADRVDLLDNGLPNILMTGFWPPTNEMLRAFSPDPDHNPGAWIGANWQKRGYNVYAFFPEFPDGLGKGEGDFEVDYQDTSGDFWPLVEQLEPIAIIAYGRSGNDHDWELEGGHRMYQPLSNWSNDYLTPYDPTPELPIANEPGGYERMSSLPIAEIVGAIEVEVPGLYPYGTTIDTSRFLCDFMGYHVNWWHMTHADPHVPAWNPIAGFIHLGYAMTLEQAVAGTDVTLRVVIDHVDIACADRFDADQDGDLDLDDYAAFTTCLSGPGVAADPDCADLDLDASGTVDMRDYTRFQRLFTTQ